MSAFAERADLTSPFPPDTFVILLLESHPHVLGFSISYKSPFRIFANFSHLQSAYPMKQNKILEMLTCLTPTPKNVSIYIFMQQKIGFSQNEFLLPPKHDSPINTGEKGLQKQQAPRGCPGYSAELGAGSAWFAWCTHAYRPVRVYVHTNTQIHRHTHKLTLFLSLPSISLVGFYMELPILNDPLVISLK